MKITGTVALCLITALKLISTTAYAVEETSPIKRGAYIFHLGGCASCHTAEDGKPLAGRRKLETPFGNFYSPNITPEPKTGIGDWSNEQFINAMTHGVAPNGENYYPAFPYTSYSKMTRGDLLDLKAYLDAQPAVEQSNREHELKFPYAYRSLLGIWKWLNFKPQVFQENPDKSPAWNRGAYIVNGPGHCGECHTPRNLMGGLDLEHNLSGNPDGPEGEKVPGLTPDPKNPISKWSPEDIEFSLQMGMLPDGDFVGGSMGHVIDNTTSKLTLQDLAAISTYLKQPTRRD